MSHYMTALAMRQTGLKPASKIVLYWLADHHNSETGHCFPSLKTLASECEMDVATVKRHLAGLESAGLIERRHRHRENGSQTSTEYTLHLSATLAQNAPPPSAKCAAPVAQNDTPHNLGRYNLGREPEYTGDKTPDASKHLPASDIDDAVAAYNDTADSVGTWPKVQRLTATRRKSLAARLAEAGGIDGWRAALDKAQESDFLSGRSGRWQGCSFDWLVKQSNFTKIMEGNYENRNQQSTQRPENRPDPALEQIARLARLRPS